MTMSWQPVQPLRFFKTNFLTVLHRAVLSVGLFALALLGPRLFVG